VCKGQRASGKKHSTSLRLSLGLLPSKSTEQNGIAFRPKTLYLYVAFGLKGKAWQWALNSSCRVLSLSSLEYWIDGLLDGCP
jgi:hypothetical protein